MPERDDGAQYNVCAAFAAGFPADGERVCIESFDGRRVSYAELIVATGRLAALLGSLGVGPGDRVAGVLDKSPEAIQLYLAASRIGAVYVPIHIELTSAEIDYILSDAEPKLVVAVPRVADSLAAWAAAASGRHLLTLDAFGAGSLAEAAAAGGNQTSPATVKATDANAIVYTSGTTGQPKGAIMTNGLVIWNAQALAACWKITSDDVLLHANPMAFGLFGTTTPVLASGACLRLLPKFRAEGVIAALPGATMFSGVPTYYARLLACPEFTADLCRDMRLFITGSAPMRADLFQAFAARTGHLLLDRYGLTEALIVTSMRVDEARRPDNSGWPLSGSHLRVVDADGQPQQAGTVGAIELHQKFMFAGYWKAPAKTAAAFRQDGWFITGDFGRLDSDGSLCVLGRGVDLIITGGLNVYPKEVETSLNAIANVAESAVIGVPHADFGEAVVAVVELVDPAAGWSTAAAQAELARGLAKYKIPKHIEVVPQMPRNTLGKIQKAALKNRLATLFMEAG